VSGLRSGPIKSIRDPRLLGVKTGLSGVLIGAASFAVAYLADAKAFAGGVIIGFVVVIVGWVLHVQVWFSERSHDDGHEGN
jgi:hypothetical protein